MKNLHSEVDVRLERRLKRKSLTNRSYKKEPCQQASEKRQCHCVGLKDPDYIKFLENLKEYGNSYALVLYNDNGEAEELKYEPLNSRDRKSSAARNEKKRVPEDSGESAAKLRRLRLGSVRNCSVGEAEELRYETLNSRDRKSSAARNEKKRVPEDSGGSAAKSRRLRSGSVHNCSVGEAEELKNSRDRKSLAARNEKKWVPEDSGGLAAKSRRLRSASVRNCSVGEAEELRYETLNNRDRKSSAARNEKKRVPEDSGGLAAKSRRLRSGSVHNWSVGRKADTTQSGFVDRDCDWQIIKHYVDYADEDYGEFLHGKRNGKSVSAEWSRSCDDSFSEGDDSSESESSETGEDYREFLESYEMEDEYVMSEQEGSDSDSDLVVLEMPSSAAEIIDVDLEDNPREDLNPRCSEFKKELLADLKKPYDSKQHQELWDLVRVRKPVSESRDTRAGTKNYPSAHKLADSYLAIYPDFAEVFGRAKEDKLKSLKLLRGFFFYIKKMGDKGIFRPWKYPELFKVTRKK